MFREVQIRFKVLRNNSDFAEIFAKDAPTLCMNRSAGIKMSLNGTFKNIAVDNNGNEVEVDWFADEIQPILIFDGIQHPLGVLMPASVVPTKTETATDYKVQAFDRCWRVSDVKTESILHLSAGTTYMSAIELLLTEAGIGTIIKTPNDAVLTEDREDWDIGTSYLDIVNQLLSEINYESLWFDERGNAILKPVLEMLAENVKMTFTDMPVDPRDPKAAKIMNVYPEITRTNDIYNSPNVFVCICSNPDKTDVMIAKAENTNPQSPLSIMRRGRRIVKVEKVDNIASQNDLQTYANRVRTESMFTGEVYSVKTLLLSGIIVSDIVAIAVDGVNAMCLEEQWEMSLGVGGLMTHQLKRVVANFG